MNEAVINYHRQRRPFILIPHIGIILGASGQPFAHAELLHHVGLDEKRVREIIDSCPRGYFLNNNLVLYQGDNVAEGSSWELQEENFPIVREFFGDLKKIFNFNDRTKFYLGVKRGKIGEIWPLIKETGSDFFGG